MTLYVPSSLQLSELLLLRDEFRDICEWEWVCECVGLESVDGRVAAAKGLGVTVTNGWMVPRRTGQRLPQNHMENI